MAVFIVAQANDRDGAFWEEIPEDIGENVDLVRRLQALLGSFSTGRAAQGGMDLSLWEVETVEAFNIADRKADWVGIGNALRLLSIS